MAAVTETNPDDAQLPSYETSVEQTGQAASKGGVHNPAFSGQQTPRYSGQPAQGASGQHSYIQMTGCQPERSGPTSRGSVVMTEAEPQTQYSLVWSTISAIFCFLLCGLAAIGLTWQARLQVFDGKYRHARHSLNVASILNCVALFFGLVFWGMVIFWFTLWFRL